MEMKTTNAIESFASDVRQFRNDVFKYKFDIDGLMTLTTTHQEKVTRLEEESAEYRYDIAQLKENKTDYKEYL